VLDGSGLLGRRHDALRRVRAQELARLAVDGGPEAHAAGEHSFGHTIIADNVDRILLAQASVAEEEGVECDARLTQRHAGAAFLHRAELGGNAVRLEVSEKLRVHSHLVRVSGAWGSYVKGLGFCCLHLVRAVEEGLSEGGGQAAAAAALLAPRARVHVAALCGMHVEVAQHQQRGCGRRRHPSQVIK
jgi:hypothetical protein